MSSNIATNAVLLLSGPSGSGKSSLVATYAEYLWETYKKKLRLYTCDQGGFPLRVELRVKQKLIEVWRMRTRIGAGGEGLIEETCALASKGWWPRQVDSHGTGDSPEAVPLVPFFSSSFILVCAKGHQVKKEQSPVNLAPAPCAICNVQVTLANGRVERASVANFPHIGGFAFDGVSSMSSWVLQALRNRRGSGGLSGGEKSAIGKFKSGDISFDGNNRADWGFAQGQAEEWLGNSISIPGFNVPPLWTALESLDESPSRTPVWGPMIAGNAKTAIAPQWAGNYIGCQQVVGVKGEKEWRLYLSSYIGMDGVEHKYKVRVDPGYLPEYLSDREGESPLTTFNLGVFFGLLNQAFEKGMGDQRFADVPDTSRVGPVVEPTPIAQQVVPAPAPPRVAAPLGQPTRPSTLPPIGGRPVMKAPVVGKIEEKDIPH